ncbi:glycoside hydrolase family 55 protein [Symbioplanes lichenis]|uniref:glycoside hydrolase family 55 protein n=1 Tax=Symbioplanes lichenis TaxID=1629072 RepID=UPI0027397565|nr:glycoside hydrolase family 55 protein [Actinoplanes lichenis]
MNPLPPGSRWANLPRRRAIASVGALIAGAGVVGAGAAAYGSSPADRDFNVRDYGATGDGKSDDTKSLQKALDAAAGTGGIVFFPPGTYVTGRLILPSRVHLRGSGGDATTLRLARGANSAILESDRFEQESAAGSDAGISGFSIRDLTLDGNAAQDNPVGVGLRIYGYGYELADVTVFNCGADGVVSAWGTAGDLPAPSHQMESRVTGLRTHDNGGHGVNFAGPHDSMFLNCLSFQNAGTGFHMNGNGYGTLMVNCHAWGVRQDISFELAASGIGCVNCYADLDGGIGVRISRNDCRWVAGYVQGANHAGDTPEIGIQFVPGAKPEEPASATIDTLIRNCATAAVDFGAERGLSSIRATLSQPGVAGVAGSGRGWIGQPAGNTQVEITHGLGHPKNLVVRPAFDLRVQDTPAAPADGQVRLFARDNDGETQLCVRFPNGEVRVLAAE